MTNVASRADFYKLLDRPELMQAAAEVGVAEGRYAKQILSWGVKKVYLVDLWTHVPGLLGCQAQPLHETNYHACERIANAHPGRVVLLRGWSHEMARHIPDASLGLVHVDATHEYWSVLRDLQLYWPKLMPGGVMSGHDYLAVEYTTRQAVDEFAAGLGIPVEVDDANNSRNACFYFRKPSDG